MGVINHFLIVFKALCEMVTIPFTSKVAKDLKQDSLWA